MDDKRLHCTLAGLVFVTIACPLWAQSPARVGSGSESPRVRALTPRIGGPWIQLVGRPKLEKWASPEAEPVDFTVFQSNDGRWQLI